MDEVLPAQPLCIKGYGYFETVAQEDQSILIKPKWISVKDMPAPKEGKFLFSYHCGVGLGAWGQAYTNINGNSERTHRIYFLVLWPMDISENSGEPFQWDESKMIEMDVYWMPLPEPPKEAHGMD